MNTDYTQARYPIREVSARTGVNSVTLRAWQRRFGLLNPQRTAKGHRLYSEQDIDTIETIVGWLERGVAISQVKPLLTTPNADVDADHWQQQIDGLMTQALNLNGESLQQQLDHLTAMYPFPLASNRVLRPWLAQWPKQIQGRPDADALDSWLHTQLSLRLSTRFTLTNQNNPGPAIALIHLETTPAIVSQLLDLEWALAGVRIQPLPLTNLASLPLIMDRLSPRPLLLNLGAKPQTADIKVIRQLSQSGHTLLLTGEFAGIHSQNLALPAAPCHKEALL
ncbi:DNA-binding transcriptional regulator, MerR family [Ferrimonas sediminum]|uniref:DNA-binding transcriptional regulator, MerR family n=1 Tax=Ferrimonas sediminum TaxID=718193 RepID=A0A1G8VJA7_9GAMM|nr:MerR family transcriptional regulator [Ferrimonas sediminum]SDJ66152.1 DNA-binding transcriptional regulator, MerR family [Ferrimonas sediminum]